MVIAALEKAILLRIKHYTRLVTCDDVSRQNLDATFCHLYEQQLADCFDSSGEYGMPVPGGVEVIALAVTFSVF